MQQIPTEIIEDPVKFLAFGWPNVKIYDKQEEILHSIRDNDETIVPAGNMLGKDFIGGFINLWFFLSRHPCRVVTTSAKDDHLRVLWGEIMRFIHTCRFPLDQKQGGPLIINHQEIKKIVNHHTCALSYMKGMVASADSIASMQGHHIARVSRHVGFECCGCNVNKPMPRTLFSSDESSSVPDDYYKMASTWAHRFYIFGNTWPCENFFKRGVKAGDIPRVDAPGYYKKVIRIRAEDSPNVRLALRQQAAGYKPTGDLVIPGVKSWEEYQKNRLLWDPIQQCVSLDAMFYEGAEFKMFPPEWLSRANSLQHHTDPQHRKLWNKAVAMGVDVGQGGDKTSWCIISRLGILHLTAMKTPDTSVIPGRTLALMNEYGLRPEQIMFDLGGGGHEHVDFMRSRGYNVSGTSFGGNPTPPDKYKRFYAAQRDDTQRREEDEVRHVYKNKRAEMYGLVRYELLSPQNELGFRIPEWYSELIRQMAPIPLNYNEEGKIYLPPKDKPNENYKGPTLRAMLGCSPDELDSFVLAAYQMIMKPAPKVVGAF